VADGAHIDVRFGPSEIFLGHCGVILPALDQACRLEEYNMSC
jgi:hypothetical protein